jgi:ribosomal-protein-alanine N-acetyltransferase
MVQLHPRLATDRLLLRPFVAEDAIAFAELAGMREIADSMISIPHPLSVSIARSIIAANAASFQGGRSVHFAIHRRSIPGMIGAIDIRDIDREHSQAELSFWIAAPEWGCGYASEAVAETIRYAFDELELNRVYAHQMVRNPASASVLSKVDMKLEGVLRERVRKWGIYEDVGLHAVLRSAMSR